MNLIHRSIWNDQTGTFVAVSENTRSAGKKISSCTAAAGAGGSFRLKILAVSLMMACGASAYAQPAGGVVSAGSATIGGTAGNMTITQTTPNVAINWQSFGINAGESVRFDQPSSSSVALNRVVGSDPSHILGSLTANGKVFLVNPNGILFGNGASVNVGGLVASTLAISDANFMANNYKFSGAGTGSVENQGAIKAADGGYVALLGANVSNQGVIAARLGMVALAAGNAVTLDMAGDKLLNITVDQGAINALVANGGMVQADGGQVLLTTQAAGSLLASAVNNTGTIQAQTLVAGENGTIKLLGGMENGTMNVAGTLDASAPAGGNGGFIETSAADVKIASGVKVTSTAAPQDTTGTWRINTREFTVGSLSTDNISGTTLSAQLVTNSVTISTAKTGSGDIHVNDAIAWSASSSPTTLSLLADGNVNINQSITATNGNLAVCCGRDVNVKLGADITTTNGSVLLSAGNDVNLEGALSTTNGNVSICAANDVNIAGKITLTHTTTIVPGQSLGLPLGLVLSAGYGAGAPGVGGGTVVFDPLAPATVTNAPTTINYNPVAYATPTDYSVNIIGAAPIQHMLVFAQGQDKDADGTTTATVSSLKGSPAGVTLAAGPGSTAKFDTPDVGTNKTITLTGYSLGGADANQYALATPCCGPAVSTTTASITAAAVPPPVVVPLPVVVEPPPAVIPPVVAPPVTVRPEGNAPLPPVWTPPAPPAATPPGYVLTVLAPAPAPASVLVVEAPPAPQVVVPAAAPVAAPPEKYQAPVRKPKPERN
ncbi:filamentous hemagglutinin [Acidovorax sp. SRB_14]|uniref:two-partner secretion domain-containing protein n=1 Tax=Acidovorax sp. SRB_14 TaxID=1962699 RepID=UPI00156529BB|nr:filamentous hemagglutinin N-terminal domain-containing protein [Acidovorax sp. SRB_14]NMM81047.1 filamentous hemagglutinin [Acidovorax sp. SRB_14]